MRHGHKGMRTKRESLKDVPLIDMSEAEQEQVFADSGEWPAWLQRRRDGMDDQTEYLARLLFCRLGLDEILIIECNEAGDACGCEFIETCMNEIRLTDALLPREYVRMELVEPIAFRRAPWPEGFQPERLRWPEEHPETRAEKPV